MVKVEKVNRVITEVFESTVSVEGEKPEFGSYPFPTARLGHNKAIREILENDFTVLASPTGTGKTVVYLTSAVESGLKTMVIVPRNGLQAEVEKYEGRLPKKLISLFERTKHCKFTSNHREAPCRAKYKRGDRWFFEYNGEEYSYPCEDCPYDIRKSIIKSYFRLNECIPILNQGNFWFLRTEAEFVVIDEADETLRSITSAVSYPERYNSDDPFEVLEWMKANVEEDIKSVELALETTKDKEKLKSLNAKLARLENKLRKIMFFREYPEEKQITYTRGRSTFVEIFDEPINIVRRLFDGVEKVCIVTATPFRSREVKYVYFDMPFRARTIYYPVGNMSVRNVEFKGHRELYEKAVDVIIKTYDFTTKLAGQRKSPIHCGNLARHGKAIYDLLVSNGRKALLMEEGRQKEYVEMFINGDYDFFCVVAAEYGYDWVFSPIQYILKMPFADLSDPRIKAIRKRLGEQKFNEWYNWEALSKVIQASGRNARGPDDFGITIILDSCFERLYKEFEHQIPKWFKDRLIWLGEVENGSKEEVSENEQG